MDLLDLPHDAPRRLSGLLAEARRATPNCPTWSPCWPSTRPARRSAPPTGRASERLLFAVDDGTARRPRVRRRRPDRRHGPASTPAGMSRRTGRGPAIETRPGEPEDAGGTAARPTRPTEPAAPSSETRAEHDRVRRLDRPDQERRRRARRSRPAAGGPSPRPTPPTPRGSSPSGCSPSCCPPGTRSTRELLRRHREDPAFARLADAVATGLGLVVLEVSPRAGMAVAAAEDSVFAVRMGDYARRAASDSADRFLHGLAHLAVAALAFPRPEDLADDGYIGRITVNGVDAFVRQACRRLEERADETRREHRPGQRRPRPGSGLAGLRPAQRHRRHQGRPPAGRFHHRHHRQGRRLPGRLRLPAAHRRRRRRHLPHHRPLPAPGPRHGRQRRDGRTARPRRRPGRPTAPPRLLPPRDGRRPGPGRRRRPALPLA